VVYLAHEPQKTLPGLYFYDEAVNEWGTHLRLPV